MPTEDLMEYQRYDERFTALVGALEPGQYGHFRGRLVRRLDATQFAAKVTEYLSLGARFSALVQAGDTIDDALAVDLRAAEIELVIEQSQFFPPLGRGQA